MLTRLVFGYSREQGRVMFGLSVVQAAATLAAVIVGHRIGIFDDAVVNGTIVMILVTCILGPWVVSRAGPVLAAQEQPADSKTAGGVLIPLAAADQADTAVELALLIRGRKEPIYPVFIVSETEDVTGQMVQGDKILARAVAQASAADCHAETIKRVHDHPGRVLTRTRKELGARTVVLPWDGAPSSSGAAQGRVVDELLLDPASEVLAARLAHPLGTCNRMVVLFPPGATRGASFDATIGLIERLAKQLGAPVLLMAEQSEAPGAQEAFDRRPEPVRTQVMTYADAHVWFPKLSERLSESDLVVVHGLRESEPTFRRESRGMAQRVAAAFPRIDLILYYGPTASVPAGVPAESTARNGVADTAAPVVLSLDAETHP
jgi:hypothetical protein